MAVGVLHHVGIDTPKSHFLGISGGSPKGLKGERIEVAHLIFWASKVFRDTFMYSVPGMGELQPIPIWIAAPIKKNFFFEVRKNRFFRKKKMGDIVGPLEN